MEFDRFFLLEKKCKAVTAKGIKKIKMFLMSDLLVVALKTGHEFLGNKYRYKCKSPLIQLWLEVATDTPCEFLSLSLCMASNINVPSPWTCPRAGYKNIMHIYCEDEIITAFFESPSQRDELKKKIEGARQDLVQNRYDGKEPAGGKSHKLCRPDC